MSTPRHTARAVVLNRDSILLMERWRPGQHYFSIPGGGIEPGETAEVAAVRELLEETSCQVVVERQLYLMRFEGTEHHIFLCRYESGEPRLPADSPEAQLGEGNRFEPQWVPVTTLADKPFTIWRPIVDQLIRDLADGFSDNLVEIVAD